jgi:hypothetical protein
MAHERPGERLGRREGFTVDEQNDCQITIMIVICVMWWPVVLIMFTTAYYCFLIDFTSSHLSLLTSISKGARSLTYRNSVFGHRTMIASWRVALRAMLHIVPKTTLEDFDQFWRTGDSNSLHWSSAFLGEHISDSQKIRETMLNHVICK